MPRIWAALRLGDCNDGARVMPGFWWTLTLHAACSACCDEVEDVVCVAETPLG
jgi:hypothetical protein